MLGIMVGEVTAYDSGEGRARIHFRGLLRRGSGTDREFTLKAPRLLSSETESTAMETGDMEVLTPPVEAGDMVFRIVGAERPYERSVHSPTPSNSWTAAGVANGSMGRFATSLA